MNIDFFTDPALVPQPREVVQIEELRLIPYADGTRVRLEFELTPFGPADRPSLEIRATRADGGEVASTSIIETAQRVFAITVHLRGLQPPQATYVFHADLYFDDAPAQHSIMKQITLPDDIPTASLPE